MAFDGFPSDETFVSIPERFFRDLLPEIEDADELRVTLYALWRLARTESVIPFLRREMIEEGVSAEGWENGLEKAVQRGTLLRSTRDSEEIFFLNSPRGRAAAEAFQKGEWSPSNPSAPLHSSSRNIFRLYEENIGALTPLIADRLKDAEKEYPSEWIAEAVEIAVKRNKRSWAYVEAILKRWKEEGHAKKQTRKNAKENYRRYIEGEYADIIEH